MYQMTKLKFIASNGIAFSENKDLKMLQKFAAKGWHVKRYKGMGYELEKGESEMVDYSIDVRHLTPDEEQEYFSMFDHAGWVHVCSSYDTHLFRAPVGTQPIYSDRLTKKEKLVRLQQSIIPAFWITFVLTALNYFIMVITEGIAHKVFTVLFFIFLALLMPCVMMLLALTYRRLRLRFR